MVVPHIPLGVTPQEYENQIRHTLTTTKKVTSKELNKSGALEQLLGTVDEIPPSGLEYLLKLHQCCILQSSNNAVLDGKFAPPLDSLIFIKIVQYMGVFDPIAVRYEGIAWRHLVMVLYASAVHYRMHAAAVGPMQTALLRIDPTGGTFTSLHLPFLRIIMMSGIFDAAFPVIDRLIHSFPAQRGHIIDGDLLCSNHLDSSAYITIDSGLTRKTTEKEVQEYYLLSAMICIGAGRPRWEDAMMYLEMVITSPTQNTATGFMLEAYKKWLLLGCLVTGQDPRAPRATNNQALKTIKQAAKPYEALVQVFTQAQKTGNLGALAAEANAGMQVWEADGNRGLANTLAGSIPRFHIIDLSKRFTSIPIRKIASYPHVDAPPEDVLAYIRQLIDAGELQAEITISKSNEPVLHFTQSTISYRSENELRTLLNQELEQVKNLAELVRLADAKLMLSKDFVGITRRNREEQGAALLLNEKSPGAEGLAENVFHIDDVEGDESMMSGIGQGGDEADEDIMEDDF